VDVGAGTGNSTKILLDRGFRVTSVEFSPTMIDCIRAKKFDPKRHRVIKARAETIGDLKGCQTTETGDSTTVA
jgi:16S rRNA A1518/A1519 N6-dimethyltransferase RsmA/KsgA/DIM1 with predicted DNA glycosylase/AP lyase activity